METRLPRERKGNRGAGHDGARGLGFGRRLPGNSATPDGTLTFDLPLGDAGGGRVLLHPFYAAGSATPTFTRATPAYTQLSDGSLFQVASGVPRSYYSSAGVYLGYLAEGARTNVILQSQTFQTTWADAIGGTGSAITADQYVAPDGTTTMDKFTAGAVNNFHIWRQNFTFTASPYTFSIYARYVNNRWFGIRMSDGTNLRYASFDLLNGVTGSLSAGTTSTIATTSQVGVYLLTVTGTMAVGTAQVDLELREADGSTEGTWNAAGTETVGLWGAQLEAASFASTYIPTTTIAVARNADVLTYPTSGNFGASVGSIYAEFSVESLSVSQHSPIIGNATDTQMPLGFDSSTVPVEIYDATNVVSGPTTAAITTNTIVKAAAKWAGLLMTAFANGSSGTSGTFTGTMTLSAIGIGYRGSGNSSLFGTIRNVRIYTRALADSQLESMTT